jgi:hypothetical protein
VYFSGLEDKTKEAEIPRGFPARRCATLPDLGAKVQKGKKLILFIIACCYWRTRRTFIFTYFVSWRHIQPRLLYLFYINPDL